MFLNVLELYVLIDRLAKPIQMAKFSKCSFCKFKFESARLKAFEFEVNAVLVTAGVIDALDLFTLRSLQSNPSSVSNKYYQSTVIPAYR